MDILDRCVPLQWQLMVCEFGCLLSGPGRLCNACFVPSYINWILGTVSEVDVSSRSCLLSEAAETLEGFHEVVVTRENSGPVAGISVEAWRAA